MELSFNGSNIDDHLASPHSLNVGHRRMFLAFENRINLFQRLALGLDPIDSLWRVSAQECFGEITGTNNENHYHDVP
jgi:hypothetical protein